MKKTINQFKIYRSCSRKLQPRHYVPIFSFWRYVVGIYYVRNWKISWFGYDVTYERQYRHLEMLDICNGADAQHINNDRYMKGKKDRFQFPNL